jgi:hypothetical protein
VFRESYQMRAEACESTPPAYWFSVVRVASTAFSTAAYRPIPIES